MTFSWLKSVGALFQKRTAGTYPAAPSTAQVENAKRVLGWADSSGYAKYSEYLAVKLGEAMEHAFAALKIGNHNLAMVWLAQASSVYDILTEPEHAKAIVRKSQQIIITPTSVPREGQR